MLTKNGFDMFLDMDHFTFFATEKAIVKRPLGKLLRNFSICFVLEESIICYYNVLIKGAHKYIILEEISFSIEGEVLFEESALKFAVTETAQTTKSTSLIYPLFY